MHILLLDIANFIPKKDIWEELFSICFLLFSSSGFWFPSVLGNKYCGVRQFILLKFMGFSEYPKRVEVILPCILMLVIFTLLISKKIILVTHLPRIGEVGVKIPSGRELSR